MVSFPYALFQTARFILVKITFTKSFQGLRPAYTKTKATATTTNDCVCDEDEFLNLGKGISHDEGTDADQQEGSGGLSFSIIFY